MQEILTIDELAAILKMSKRQIYTMCETRTRNGSMKENPLPVLRINGNLRFSRASIQEWLSKIQEVNVVAKTPQDNYGSTRFDKSCCVV
jgi:DNA-binding transcriptional regulator GbsR (MarR family)